MNQAPAAGHSGRRRSAIRPLMMKQPLLLIAFCCLGHLTEAQQTADTSGASFQLSTDDPNRAPSPFIGNGRLGLVIPPLGIGASTSLMAGMYEHGAGDVPRIVAVPAWNDVGVFDGKQWIDTTDAVDAVSAYRQ